MKRRIAITFIILSLIVILSLSFISAGWFSDFLGKITGKFILGSTTLTFETQGTTPAGDNYQDYIDFNVSISDDASLDTINVSLYDSSDNYLESKTSTISPFSDSFTGLDYGTYYLNATANDTDGNFTFTDPVLIVTLQGCGDGIRQEAAGEECDDGNTANGDGCSSTCQIEAGLEAEEINVPIKGMCSTRDSGLKCDETAAENYCKYLDYAGYIAGTKQCVLATTDKANKADAPNAAIGNCDTGIIGEHYWINKMKCYQTEAAQECVDSDADTDSPYFVGGNVSIDGTVEKQDTCIDTNTLEEAYCEGGLAKTKQIICSAGCETDDNGLGVCALPEQGLFCEKDTPVSGLLKVPPTSRQIVEGTVYYCGPDLFWHEANATLLDISCIRAGTCPPESKCLADYECISNTCVDGYCISITRELQEQRNILQKIWCFLTNMRSYFCSDGALAYCSDCLYPDNTDDAQICMNDRCPT